MGFRLPKCRWFQRRPRVAWCCRWVLGGAAVLALAAWVFTGFGMVHLWVEDWGLMQVRAGSIWFINDTQRKTGGSSLRFFGHRREGISHKFHDGFPSWSATEAGIWPPTELAPRVSRWTTQSANTDQYGIVLPLWLMIVITAPPALAAWRHRWVVKRELGLCHICGYARDGLAPGAKCPECGHAQVT